MKFYHRGTNNGFLMQGESPGPNWYEMVGLPLSSAGLFFSIVPVPSSINPGLNTHSSPTDHCYHTSRVLIDSSNNTGIGGTFRTNHEPGIFAHYVVLATTGAAGDSSPRCAIIKRMTKKNYGWR